jgi:hypothetical protein
LQIARGLAGIVATVALIGFMIAGYQQNSMLARRLFVSPQLCVSDPEHYHVVDMKIDRCVPTNVAGQWDEVHNILQGSMAVFAIAFGTLFVSGRIRKRRETGANGS